MGGLSLRLLPWQKACAPPLGAAKRLSEETLYHSVLTGSNSRGQRSLIRRRISLNSNHIIYGNLKLYLRYSCNLMHRFSLRVSGVEFISRIKNHKLSARSSRPPPLHQSVRFTEIMYADLGPSSFNLSPTSRNGGSSSPAPFATAPASTALQCSTASPATWYGDVY